MRFQNYFSYVKDIYIELIDYSYFHSPSQQPYTSKRFKGRKRLKERLTDLLIRSETRSGAYLIAGNRGVGKSSVVNQVLDELLPVLNDSFRNRVIRIVLFTFLLALLAFRQPFNVTVFTDVKEDFSGHLLWIVFTLFLIKIIVKVISLLKFQRALVYIPIILVAFSVQFIFHTKVQIGLYFLYSCSWIWLAEVSGNKNDLKIKPTWNIKQFIVNMFDAFHVEHEKYPKNYHSYLLQDLFYTTSALVFVLPWLFENSDPVTFADILTQYFLSLVIFTILVRFARVFTHWLIVGNRGQGQGFSNLINRLIATLTEYLSYLRNTINYSRKITIRLNLGHEELQEVEILKLIGKKIYKEYKKISNSFWGFPFNLSNTFIKAIFIFVVLQIVYGNPEFRKRTYEFKEAIGFTALFPTQVLGYNVTNRSVTFEEFICASEGIRKESRTYDLIYKVAGYFDYAFTNIYVNVIRQLTPTIFGKIEINLNPLDYFFAVYFIIGWTFLTFILSRKPLGIIKHSHNLKRLRDLNDRMDAQVQTELQKDLGNRVAWFKFLNTRKMSFPIANAREIEAELLSILDDIDRLPQFFNRPEFIFILDELDKIGRHHNQVIEDKEEEEQEEVHSKGNDSRKHRESVLKLLANLKHFFTTARAKFIFIAGREMFDASLADISDRNYFLGSIFHDIIYVNSFLTDESKSIPEEKKGDEGHMSYYTSVVEEFLCQFLIPKNWDSHEKSISLKTYKEYLYELHNVKEIRNVRLMIDLKPKISSTCRVYDVQKFKRGFNKKKTIEVLKTLDYSLKSLLARNIPWWSLLWFNIFCLRLGLAWKLRWCSHEDKFYSAAEMPLLLSSILRIEVPKYTKHQILKQYYDEIGVSKQADYVLFNLRNFITYISYRSGGAPKKLSYLIEKYVKSIDNQRKDLMAEQTQFKTVVLGKNSNNLYLHFAYNDLYTFGVMNYLTTPYLHNISRHLKKHDDKLAVASTYLLDHIYKYHNTGFSWRNLEVTPEIVDVNKSHSLRELIIDIIEFLSTTHLNKVVSGLFDFRFNQRLAIEVRTLSKLNGRESAAFNFTLDESQEIKRHYKRKLESLYKEYDHGSMQNTNGFYINSLGFIHGSLGDLHYYDQEYDDAIVQYNNAMQVLRQKDSMDNAQLIVMLRIMLKLGLTFEKKRSLASALLTYENLSFHVIRQLIQTLDLKEYQIVQCKFSPEEIIGYNTEAEKHAWYILPVTYGDEKPRWTIQRPTDRTTTKWNQILRIEDDVVTLLSPYSLPNVFRIQTMTEAMSSVRLLYQPFVAKLYIKEKEKPGGIKVSDVQIAEREIEFLTSFICEDDRKLIGAEYYNKIGDILFFKNYNVDRMDCARYYTKAFDISFPKLSAEKKSVLESSIELITNLSDKAAPRLSSDSICVVANNLSDYGDVILARTTHQTLKTGTKTVLDFSSLDKDDCLHYYWCSSELYRYNHEFKKSAFQRLKMLYVIEEFCFSKEYSINVESCRLHKLVADILDLIYQTYNASSQPELEKLRRILKLENIGANMSTLLQQLPAYAEVQEAIAIYFMIRIKLNKEPRLTLERVGEFANGPIPSMYSRLTVLNFKARYNYSLIADLNIEKDFHAQEKLNLKRVQLLNDNDRHKLIYLIVDSIYCLTSIIRILTTAGVSYITNHSLFVFAFERRGDWCKLWETLRNGKNKNLDIDRLITHQLSSESLDTLTSAYNYERALKSFQLSVEGHEGKSAYNDLIDKMFYLEDDFGDEYVHFHAALERFRVSEHEKNVTRLKRLEGKARSAKMTSAESYLSEFSASFVKA